MRSSSTVIPPSGVGPDAGGAFTGDCAENLRPQSLPRTGGRRAVHRSALPPMRPNMMWKRRELKLFPSSLERRYERFLNREGRTSGANTANIPSSIRFNLATTHDTGITHLLPPQLHSHNVDHSADIAQPAPHWPQGSSLKGSFSLRNSEY